MYPDYDQTYQFIFMFGRSAAKNGFYEMLDDGG